MELDREEDIDYSVLSGDPELDEVAYKIVGYVLLGGLIHKKSITREEISSDIGEELGITLKAISLLVDEELLGEDTII